jgi:hypothetical protein
VAERVATGTRSTQAGLATTGVGERRTQIGAAIGGECGGRDMDGGNEAAVLRALRRSSGDPVCSEPLP